MADELYDLEFGSLPCLERRIYQYFVSVDTHIRWVDEHEESEWGLEDFTF